MRTVCLLLLTAAVASAAGPLSPNEERATFQIVPGFTIELVAAEPDVVDPVAMCFDERGRMYVCEMRGYPNAGVGTGNETRGRVVWLEDRNGDGVFETRGVFADGLRFPMGVLPWKGGVIVAVAPDLIHVEDTDGDSKADRRTVLYTGFNTANIQQMANGLQWAADGWVYGTAGNPGGVVQSAEVKVPPVELRGRGFRFKPDVPGSLEPTSGGGQYGIASDPFGRWFTNTNSQHLRQIVLRDEYLRRNPSAAVSAVTVDIPDHGPACKVFRISPFEAWRVERTTRRSGGTDARRFPATELIPGGFITSGCSPLMYSATAFPPAYRGSVFGCDPANNLVHRDVLEPAGPLFTAKRGEPDREFLASTDNWFRPVHLHLGPDGAVYLLDFYREVIETPLSLPDDIKAKLNLESRGRGRVWRIRLTDTRLSAVTVPSGVGECLPLLAHPNPWVRLTAQRILAERMPKLTTDDFEPVFKAARGTESLPVVLGAAERLGALNDAHVLMALSDPLAGNREVGLRAAEGRAESLRVRAAVSHLVVDPDPMVRFQLALTAQRLPPNQRLPILVELLKKDGSDGWCQSAVLIAAGERVSPLIEAVLKAGATGSASTFLTRAAASASGNADELAAVVKLVPAVTGLRAADEALIEGLGQGMRSRGRSLSDWLAKPPADLIGPAARIRDRLDLAATVALTGDVPSIRLLAYARFDTAAPVLEALLSPQVAVNAQSAAVRSLATHTHPEVANKLLSVLAGYSPAVRREVLEHLLARPDRAAALLTAIEKKTVRPAELDPTRVAQLKTSKNAALRQRAETLLGPATASARQPVVASYRSAAELKGDIERGRTVFKAQCATCHKLGSDGHEVGPNLLSVVPGKSFDDLLTAVFDPNREVDPRYLNYQLATADGRTLTGVLVGETAASVTLRRADGAEEVVRRADIETLRATGLSLMPDGLEQQLKPQDVADLFAYLRTAK